MSFDNIIKKLKSRVVSLNILFITGLSVIFLLASISLAIIASNGIESLGEFAAQVYEKSIRGGASFLFLEETRKKAEEYSNAFDQASDRASLLAVQLSIAWDNFQYYNFPANFQLEYTDISPKNPDAAIRGILKNNLKFCYWGEGETLPLEQQQKIFYFSNYFRLIKYIQHKNRYNHAGWVTFKNEKYFLSYSDVTRKIYANLPGRNSLNNFFTSRINIQKSNWTDVYRDITGRLIVTTYKEIIDSRNRTVGLAGLDIFVVNLLKNSLLDVKVQEKKHSSIKGLVPFSFVVDGKNSKLIDLPNKYYASFGLPAQNFKDYDYRQELTIKLQDSKYSCVRNIAKMILKKNEGFSTIILGEEEYFVAFSKIPCNNWVFGVVYPAKRLFISDEESQNWMIRHTRQFTVKLILAGILFLLLFAFLITRFFNKYVLGPIVELRKSTLKLGKGYFDTKLEETGVPEVKGLTRSFNEMKDELNNYIKELKSEIIERKNIETEIEVAKEIQRSLLPNVSSIFQRDKIDLYGEFSLGKVIAKNCYDFFYLKKNRIALLIADVFGEGEISAAFYMAVLKSNIRDICLDKSENPAKALGHINKFLCEEYKVRMCVSLFLIYYDLDTGTIQYGNAGHYAALQIKKNGECQRLGCFGNAVLGSLSASVYEFEEKTLKVGDALFLYTAGVINATSKNGDYYGDDRLISLLLKNRKLSSEQFCRFLFKDIKLFENVNNSDDTTMLMFKRKS